MNFINEIAKAEEVTGIKYFDRKASKRAFEIFATLVDIFKVNRTPAVVCGYRAGRNAFYFQFSTYIVEIDFYEIGYGVTIKDDRGIEVLIGVGTSNINYQTKTITELYNDCLKVTSIIWQHTKYIGAIDIPDEILVKEWDAFMTRREKFFWMSPKMATYSLKGYAGDVYCEKSNGEMKYRTSFKGSKRKTVYSSSVNEALSVLNGAEWLHYVRENMRGR